MAILLRLLPIIKTAVKTIIIDAAIQGIKEVVNDPEQITKK